MDFLYIQMEKLLEVQQHGYMSMSQTMTQDPSYSFWHHMNLWAGNLP